MVISVNETLKGTVNGDKIAVTLSGGVADGIGQTVSDTPSFNQGENAVVFLKKLSKEQIPKSKANDKITEDQYDVYHGSRGKYTIAGDKVGTLPAADFKNNINKILRGQPLSPGELHLPASSVSFPYTFSGYSWPHPPNPVVYYRINDSNFAGGGSAVQGRGHNVERRRRQVFIRLCWNYHGYGGQHDEDENRQQIDKAFSFQYIQEKPCGNTQSSPEVE